MSPLRLLRAISTSSFRAHPQGHPLDCKLPTRYRQPSTGPCTRQTLSKYLLNTMNKRKKERPGSPNSFSSFLGSITLLLSAQTSSREALNPSFQADLNLCSVQHIFPGHREPRGRAGQAAACPTQGGWASESTGLRSAV